MVGENVQEIFQQDAIRLEFYNYEGEEILPTSVKITPEIPKGSIFEVNQEWSTHSIGTRTSGGANLESLWKVEGNVLIVQGKISADKVITSIKQYKLQSLTTEEKEYKTFLYKN